MKISVSIKPNAKVKKIEKVDEGRFKAWVKESPVEGKANLALVKVLADYFDVAPSRINIVSGYSSKKKIVEITKNLSPDTFPKIFTPSSPVLYVLEVNSGWSDKNKIKIGNKIVGLE